MKTVVVTGATGGIGSAIARHLANNSCDLILSSRNEQRLALLKQTLAEKSLAKVHCQVLDYAHDNTMKLYNNYLDTIDTAIDGLVIITPRPAIKASLFPHSEEWQQLFNAAFIGPLTVIESTVPYIKNGGKIVIVSGISSCQYMPGKTAFSVLRTMWLAQAKGLAYELGPTGISVNTVSPGGVMTAASIEKMQQKAQQNQHSFEQQYANSVANVPLRKYASPEEIASIVAFFLSEQSNHITGTNLVCDGGFNRCY